MVSDTKLVVYYFEYEIESVLLIKIRMLSYFEVYFLLRGDSFCSSLNIIYYLVVHAQTITSSDIFQHV